MKGQLLCNHSSLDCIGQYSQLSEPDLIKARREGVVWVELLVSLHIEVFELLSMPIIFTEGL